MSKNGQRSITVTLNISERQYRSLRNEARVIRGVFGIPTTIEDVAQSRIEDSIDIALKSTLGMRR